MAEALARVGDDITHAHAATGGILGGIAGFLGGVAVGVLIGAAVVAGAAALAAATVATGGAALIVGGAWLVAIGGTVALGGMGGKLGAHLGAHLASGAVGPPKGKITRGSPNVFANGRAVALACWSQVACQDHGGDQRISEGSRTVFANGHGIARIGDRGMCGFYIRKADGNGSPTVFVGGDPNACHGLPVGSGAPELLDKIFTGMEWIGGGVALVGLTLMTLGGGLAAASSAGLAMTARLGVSIAAQTLARVGAQVAVGWGLSKAGSLGGSLIAGSLTGGDPFWTGYGGEVGSAVAPFAGGRAYKAIDAVPWRLPGGSSWFRAGGGGWVAGPDNPKVGRLYEQIEATPDHVDIPVISRKTGVPEPYVSKVKDHLFRNQHDLEVGNYEAGTFTRTRGKFEPDEGIAQQWTKASSDQPMTPEEIAGFRRLMAHEYVEQNLMQEGLPYRASDWREGNYGYYNYSGETPGIYGAHDLSPNPNPNRPAFGHYNKINKPAPPELKEDLSNMDEVLGFIRNMEGMGSGGNP